MLEATWSLSALSEEFVELSFHHDPVAATAVGIHDYDRLLPDDSPEGIQARVSWLRDFERRLRAGGARDALTPAQRVDLAFLESRVWALRTKIEDLRVHAVNPVRYPERALRGVYFLLARPFAPFEERKEAILERLVAIPDYLERAWPNLVPVPEVVVRTALDVTLAGPSFVDEVTRALRRSFPGEAERIEFAAQRARVGFLRYQEHLERKLLPRAGGPLGIGADAMNAKLKHEHLLDLDVEALDQLGTEHIARARGMLEAEAKRLDPSRTWREQIIEARTRHPERTELRDAYVQETERALRFVRERHIAPVLSTALEITDTPVFQRAFTPYSAYLPAAPFDSDQTGYFFITPVDLSRPREAQEKQLEEHSWARLPLVVLHEAYPGRHLQTGHANRAWSRLRQLSYDDLYTQGWALYCAEMMYQEGYFTDAVTRLFQLKDLLWRACRVVIDARIQSGRMTFAEAVSFLVDEAMLEPAAAELEVKRYLLSPTQPLSYLVGMLEIVKLRDQTRAKLGARFDLHDFHAMLLGVGAIPPALVGEELWDRMRAATT